MSRTSVAHGPSPTEKPTSHVRCKVINPELLEESGKKDEGDAEEEARMAMKIADRPCQTCQSLDFGAVELWLRGALSHGCNLVMLQELESLRMIPEGALDRFKKQSRRLHAEPLKLTQALAHALHSTGVNIDDFLPNCSARLPPLCERKTLVVTCDEDPKQILDCKGKGLPT